MATALLWLTATCCCRDEIVPPTNETVAQVFSRISAWRDSMDGPQFDDQGLLNTDPRTIAVPESYVNNIPTDIRGVSFSRTPAMVSAVMDAARIYHCKTAEHTLPPDTQMRLSTSC